jgi:hypothetical protein
MRGEFVGAGVLGEHQDGDDMDRGEREGPAGVAGADLLEELFDRRGQAQDVVDGVVVAVVVAAPESAVADLDGLRPVLRVDDGDAAVPDHEVVDVGAAAAGPASIVQHPPALVSEGLQNSGGKRFGQRGGLIVAPAAVRPTQRRGQFPLLGVRLGGRACGRGSRDGEQALRGDGGRRTTVCAGRRSCRPCGHAADLPLHRTTAVSR